MDNSVTLATDTPATAGPEERARPQDLRQHVVAELRRLGQLADVLANRVEDIDAPRLSCLIKLAVAVEAAANKLGKAGRSI